MAYVDRPGPSRRFGFTTYADDTPRFEQFGDPARDEGRFADEDAAPDWEDEPLQPAAKPRLAALLAACLVAAVATAAMAFIGTALIGSLHHQAPAPREAPSAAMAMAQPEIQSAPAPPPAPPRLDATAKPRQKSAPRHLLAPLDCARPASPAQRMVCRSPGLLAADHRMTRAYAEAQAAGAPPRRLRRDQARWLKAREAAARRSRHAVASLYRRRIEDLESRPYGACAGFAGERTTAAGGPSGRASLAGVTHWLLSVPRKVVSPRDRTECR